MAEQTRNDTHYDNRAWLTLGLLSVFWGGSFPFYRILAPVLPPFMLVLGRVGLAALFLHIVLLIRKQPLKLSRTSALWMLVLGALNCAIPFSFYAWSGQRIPGGVAATLNATTPIFTVIALHVATSDQKLNRRTILGCLCAFAGVFVLIGRDFITGQSAAWIWGELGCLCATTSYAIGGVFARRLAGVAPLHLATGQMTAAALCVLPLAIFMENMSPLRPMTTSSWSAVAGFALLSTAIPYMVYFRLLARYGVTMASLVTFMTPVTAILMGAAFLGERLSWNVCLGGVLIGGGLIVIDGRILRRLWKREEPTPA
ncbi:DMT family transporter [Acetobacter sp. AN02]|uniref:DMT family transporter n=1 Tax=Acetobacter sp. AN02 TaxID=2894186 RepID=UPI002434293B|nr:DMT family transporter [Acetobacter sp. AN02]MDG6094561.1 DMT family transporter [Acetobacter sp. AN02]